MKAPTCTSAWWSNENHGSSQLGQLHQARQHDECEVHDCASNEDEERFGLCDFRCQERANDVAKPVEGHAQAKGSAADLGSEATRGQRVVQHPYSDTAVGSRNAQCQQKLRAHPHRNATCKQRQCQCGEASSSTKRTSGLLKKGTLVHCCEHKRHHELVGVENHQAREGCRLLHAAPQQDLQYPIEPFRAQRRQQPHCAEQLDGGPSQQRARRHRVALFRPFANQRGLPQVHCHTISTGHSLEDSPRFSRLPICQKELW
mmetsp:Transcript_17744/g.41691  ORF Transcript_17744/g.41691 Transcript_17744/m.41691 type:complete len:259 (-) Transcript_17744:673-1449(-)